MSNTIASNYADQLTVKAIHTPSELELVVKCDQARIMWAIAELQTLKSATLLHNFFTDAQAVLTYVEPWIDDQSLYHIGLEIYQPLDLFLDSLQQGSPLVPGIELVKFIRFSASQSLQKRVKAYVEIMRLWITVEGETVLLELFDIHRPCLVPLAYKNGSLPTQELLAPALLDQDEIWHYALLLNHPDDVLTLHRYFHTFTDNNPAYTLPFTEIVHNRQDGSFYTKLINQHLRVELEFVAENQF